jgi:endonuclease YncB( thermonuclease family)
MGSCLLRAGSPTCHVWFGKVTYIGDGDTIYVRQDGTRAVQRIRITGIQAMEQTVYAPRASQRRGECHAVEATDRLEQLLRAGKMRVRLAAQDPASHSGSRPRRSIAVKINHRWRDVGRILVTEGHALWLPNYYEYAWNRDYSILAARAAKLGANLWDPTYCGPGPADTAQLKMWANWKADGNDDQDPNGEWIRIKNLDPVNAVALGGWWVRDSALRRYTFPYTATVGPASEITVYVGEGDTTDSEFYWGQRKSVFENATDAPRYRGDGAYLFDPQGDLRLAFMYPCRESCTDPNAGAVQLAAKPSGNESVTLTNGGAAAVDLEDYRLASGDRSYAFGPDSLLQPGETMQVKIGEALQDDQPLVRHWATDGPILPNGGGVVQLRSTADVGVACTSWGSRSC